MSTHILGIDIGGTKIAAGLVAPTGEIKHARRAPTPAASGTPAVLRTVVELAREVLDAASAEGLTVAAVGVGTTGHVDRRRGVISYASQVLPGWAGTRLVEELAQALALPVSIDNDVNALAIGEGRFGAGLDLQDALYVAVGTGVGGALVLGNAVWRGRSWTAGEIGHLLVDWQGGRICSCGQRGHLEAYAAGPAIAARYHALAGVGAAVDMRAVAQRAHDGDPRARAVIAEGAHILGEALGGLLNAVDVQAVIVGGSLIEIGDLWWHSLEAALRANPMPGPARVILRPAKLGQNAVLVGAAALALDEHMEQASL